MHSGKTWRLSATLLAVGTMWLSTLLCSAQSPPPPSTPAVTIVATSLTRERHPLPATDNVPLEVAGTSLESASSSPLFPQPEPTPPPEISLFTILTPERCLILGFVGGVVFIIIYGLQIAIVRRLR